MLEAPTSPGERCLRGQQRAKICKHWTGCSPLRELGSWTKQPEARFWLPESERPVRSRRQAGRSPAELRGLTASGSPGPGAGSVRRDEWHFPLHLFMSESNLINKLSESVREVHSKLEVEIQAALGEVQQKAVDSFERLIDEVIKDLSILDAIEKA